MSASNKSGLMALYRAPYNRSIGESSNNPFFNINMSYADFIKKGFCAPGERFSVPESNLVVRWVRVRSANVVAGAALIQYNRAIATAAAGSTASKLFTAATLPVTDIGGGIVSIVTTPGEGQFRKILDSDGATNASVLTILESDNSNYTSDADLPEAYDPLPDNTSTYHIHCPWEVALATATTDKVTCIALGTVTNGNYTMVVEEGLVPAKLTGAVVQGDLLVPDAADGTLSVGTGDLVVARAIFAVTGGTHLVDFLGRFKQ